MNCNFCGLQKELVGRLIFGKNKVCICDKCIESCYAMLHPSNKNTNIAPKQVKGENLPKQQDVCETDNRTLEELLAELKNLTGLKKLKAEVEAIINQIKIRKIRESKGLSQVATSNHLVFMGNPGTGKTTVARLLGSIYKKLGLLSEGQLIEVDKSGLVAGYAGQTAIKTQKVIDESIGGILFIDEAYSLVTKGTGGFGQEAIDVLLKEMEDNRDDFIVIVAGYSDLMNNFLKSNPGLESRFNNFIDFEDYNGNELYEIFTGMCKKHKYILENATIEPLKQYFANMYENRSENYANARDVRNFFERALKRQTNRLVSSGNLTDNELVKIIESDLFGSTTMQTQKLDEQENQNYFWSELQKQLKNKGYNVGIKDFTEEVSKYYAASEKKRYLWFGFEFEIYTNANFRVEIWDHFYYGFSPSEKQFTAIAKKISPMFRKNHAWSGWKLSDKFDLDFWNLNSEGFEQLKDINKRESFIVGLVSEMDWYIKEFVKKAKEAGV